MTTHIIQLSEDFETYLKKQFGTVTPSFKIMRKAETPYRKK